MRRETIAEIKSTEHFFFFFFVSTFFLHRQSNTSTRARMLSVVKFALNESINQKKRKKFHRVESQHFQNMSSAQDGGYGDDESFVRSFVSWRD